MTVPPSVRCEGAGYRIGFGDCEGTITPAADVTFHDATGH
jgi:hypothetical protein